MNTYISYSFLQNKQLYYLFLIPLFCINPSFALLLAALLLWYSSDKTKLLKPFSIFLAIWISLVNITKIPTSDQINYLNLFTSAGSLPFNEWWLRATNGSFKDPIFYLFTYYSNFLVGGNEKIYLFLLSFINYTVLYSIAIKFSEDIQTPPIYGLTAVLVITFFTQYFTLTLHIIRQIVASTLVITAIVLKAIDNRNRYILLCLGVLVHSSCIFLALLSFIPWFKDRMHPRQIIICMTILGIFVILFGNIGAALTANINIIGISYLFRRMQDDATDMVEGFSPSVLLMVLLPLLIISIKLLVYDLPHHHYITRKNHSPFYCIIYIFIVLSAFILGMSSAPLIQYRYFMMSYVFIPFILPYLLYTKNYFHKVYLITLNIFFIFRFFQLHNSGDFHYDAFADIFTYSLHAYFI